MFVMCIRTHSANSLYIRVGNAVQIHWHSKPTSKQCTAHSHWTSHWTSCRTLELTFEYHSSSHLRFHIKCWLLVMSFWKKLEIYNGQKYPKFIKKILNSCTFDEHSIPLLNKENLKEIELYVRKNPNLLKNTCYEHENVENFHFKIGHKFSILAIPAKLHKLNEEIKLLRENKKLEKKLEKKSEQKPEEGKESEESVSESWAKLFMKINNYETNNKIKFNVTKDSIEEFKETTSGFKCSIVCPKCHKTWSCYQNSNSYWIISNFTNHYRKQHSTEDISEDNIPRPSPQPQSPFQYTVTYIQRNFLARILPRFLVKNLVARLVVSDTPRVSLVSYL